MRLVKRMIRFIEEDIPAYVLGLIAVLIFADVFARYVFQKPLKGTAELSIVLIVWIVYLTSAALVRRSAHISVDSLYEILPRRVQLVLDVFTEIVLITVLGLITAYAIPFVATGHFIMLPSTGISKRMVTLAIVVGFTLSLIHAVFQIIRTIQQFRTDTESYERPTDPYEIDAIENLDTASVRTLQADFEKRVMS